MTGGARAVKPIRRAKPPQSREGAPPRTAYSIAEVAESLGLSTRQVYRLAESGQLPVRRIGGLKRVLVDDLTAFLAAS